MNITNNDKIQLDPEGWINALFNAATDSIAIFDSKFNFVRINKSFECLIGLTKEEIIGKNIKEIFPTIVDSRHYKGFLNVKDTGKPYFFYGKGKILKNLDNNIFSVRAFQVGEGLGVITSDLTDYTNVELDFEKNRTQRYLDTINVILITINSNHKITMINNKGCEILGYKEEDIINKDWFDNFIPNRYRKELKQVFDLLIDGTSESLEYFENPILTKDGKELMIAWRNVSFKSYETNEFYILSSGTDITNQITEEKKYIQELQILQDLSLEIYHDSKNNLNKIKDYSKLLMNNGETDFSPKIYSLTKKVQKLYKHSVELAKGGLVVKKTEKVNLKNTLSKVAQDVIPSNITFKISDLPTFYCDRVKIIQIFQNLFENAVTHGKPKKIEVIGDSNSILIRNDGLPIPVEDRPKLFNNGFTTKEKDGGLGNIIIKKLVEAHGWTIELIPDEYTTFRINFKTNPE